MHKHILFVICFLFLTGCFQSYSPAPVTKLGLNTANVAGSILVHQSDTLWGISKKLRLPMREIILANNIVAPYKLTVGQRIKLPEPQRYQVRAQDTLYSIARMFNVNASQLVRVNNLHKPYYLHTGQILRVPRTEKRSPPRPVMAKKRQYRTVKPYREQAQKTHIKPYNHMASANRNGFIWPVRGRLLSSFGPKTGGLHNDGINIAVPRGTPVKSVSNGRVVYIGDDLNSFGNLVLVRHSNGWISAYGHLQDIKVSKGLTINQGQTLGTVGRTGNVTTPQLHFELRKGSRAINPQQYLS